MPGGGGQINMMGMIVEIVEKHPKSYQYGCSPCNVYPLKVTTELHQTDDGKLCINRKICLIDQVNFTLKSF